jgi:hypothetical protein
MARMLHIDNTAPLVALSSTGLLAFAGGAVVLLFVVWTYSTWRKLQHIPGPASAGLTSWWMFRNSMGGGMHLALKDAVDKYGKH